MVKSGIVTEEEALSNSSSPEELRLGFRGITKGSAAAGIDMDFGDLAGGAKTIGKGKGKGKAGRKDSGKGGADDNPNLTRGFDF
jgi:hypothetical protein